MKICFRFIVVLMFVVIAYPLAHAQPPHEPWMHEGLSSTQSSPGGVTAQTIEPVTANPGMVDPDVFSEPPPAAYPSAPAAPIGASVEARIIWSRHVQAYIIPASYLLTPDLKLEVSIPYLDKDLKGEYTDEELEAHGVGDVSAGLKYRYGTEARFQGVTSIFVKFPTGEYRQFEGRNEQITLGTGSYDFIISQTVSKIIGSCRLLANVGYRWNTDYDYTETDNFGRKVDFEGRVGDLFNYLAGVQYFTPLRWLTVYLNVSGLFQERSHIKETNTADGSVIRDADKNDRLRTVDLNLGCKVQVTKNIGIRAGVFAPVLTEYDPGVRDHASRDWVADLGIVGRF